jgi:ABC-type lipoprotein release transport system permease subunit
MLRLRPGTAREDVTRFVDSLGLSLDVQDSSDLTSGIERTVHIETIALVTLGIIVTAVGFVVTGQMLRRQSVLTDSERVTLAALGMDGGHLVRLSVLRGASLAVPGGLGSIVIAVGLSPLFPVGIGRIADPHVGVHLDVTVVAAGMAATLVVVPLGVLIGRLAWGPIAAGLLVVPRPMTPVLLLAAMCTSLLAVALIASLVPAARAVRSRSAVILRSE